MSAIETFNSWLQIIAKPMGLDDLKLNDDNACAFAYDDCGTIAIKLNLTQQVLMLSAPIPMDADFSLDQQLRQDHAVTAVLDDTPIVCYTMTLQGLQANDFFSTLHKFLQSIKLVWQQHPQFQATSNREVLKPSQRA